ncbi:double-strand break repair protein AddB [Salibaculum sp.]|uniref:double-strand break repair protein AddB n=1 Tax=Salibaculum sp. TaxID=2855480 RepID=UPI002B4820EF|nr:double-strand break repair protein AddB [Salibaculum sp.]HKL69111.1 double-strand break repair protein AddB [Salibaculum sp.]
MSDPGLFAIPTGCDFGHSFLNGLDQRFGHLPPEDFARIEILVNTRRTQRRLRALFDRGPARLLPRLRLITDLGQDPGFHDLPLPVSPLRRRLDLSNLVGKLLQQDPTLAPRESRFALAESLAALFSEMHGEGVDPARIAELDIEDESGHWHRALRFITLVQHYFEQTHPDPDPEARQRLVVERLARRWQETPPDNPVIVAGSTGSRGTTAQLIRAVLGLPRGHVVLPGVDQEMPRSVWDRMTAETGGEDHPQFRFKALCDMLEMHPADIRRWVDTDAPDHGRDTLISLALRPAPVTDQWITDGPALPDLGAATADLTLLEAPSPRAEASAIALRMRQAAAEDQTVALITPDRILARQVTSAMERWGIRPDDSAGTPLHLTPPGRFLRHTARLLAQRLTPEALLTLLKHPLCHSGARGRHGLCTTALELHLRRHGPAFPNGDNLRAWADLGTTPDPARQRWATWLADLLPEKVSDENRPLSDWVARHRALSEGLATGPDAEGSGGLWEKAAGREALRMMTELTDHASAAGQMNATDYEALIGQYLSGGEVRDQEASHPKVLIWGTLEARVQSADLVILGGLNEGTWPEPPAPDPWLNRTMRRQAGLLLPERRIGLSAHDFQIAVTAPEVVISRAVRDTEAETVASRWLNRLLNLLGGLTETGGPEAIAAMRARGDALLRAAAALETPPGRNAPASRPSPRPPAAARPRQLSVTQIKTLIRDPYAIYARHVLGLKPLDPLVHSPDAALRGNIIHDILEAFLPLCPDPGDPAARDLLLEVSEQLLVRDCPWPSVQRLWLARVARFARAFLADEVTRRQRAAPGPLEKSGRMTLDGVDFTLTAKADRLDLTEDGAIWLYDYKSGEAPQPKAQELYDKQLILEAAMIERGGFDAVGPASIAGAEYLQLSSDVKSVAAWLDRDESDFLQRFTTLMQRWASEDLGYTARRSNMTAQDTGTYDHLARYGEWDETQDANPEDLP